MAPEGIVKVYLKVYFKMTKLIGIKELQQNTKKVREAVAKGTHFIVVYRSKPIFEINPFQECNLLELSHEEVTDEIKEAAKAAKKSGKKDLIDI